MDELRLAVMEALCRSDERKSFRSNPYYYTLPKDVSTNPGFIHWTDPEGITYKIKVLSTAEAKMTSKTKARRPHRILVYDEVCERWIFAGKYAQHCRCFKDELIRLAHRINLK